MRIEELIELSCFKKPRTLADVKAKLANHGFHIARTSLSGPLQTLCRQKKLRRQKGVAGDESTHGYSNCPLRSRPSDTRQPTGHTPRAGPKCARKLSMPGSSPDCWARSRALMNNPG